MRIKTLYKIYDDQHQLGDQLEDMLNWPDLSSLEEAQPYVATYLDNKYGVGNYSLISVEAA